MFSGHQQSALLIEIARNTT